MFSHYFLAARLTKSKRHLKGIGMIKGQNFDKIATQYFNNGIQINKIDSIGRKQGLWIHYKMFFNSKCSALSQKVSDTCFREISKGEYLNNLKIGKWIYYNDGGCYFDEDRIEIFCKDGSVNAIKKWLIKSNVFNQENTFYNKDSSLVTSKIIIADVGTMNIKCINKDKCVASFENKIISTFPYDKLELKQYKFANGFYNRELKSIKNSN
jgi:hypothetical protein